MYRIFLTFIPTEAAACGCSPQALNRKPKGNLYITNQTINTTASAINAVG